MIFTRLLPFTCFIGALSLFPFLLKHRLQGLSHCLHRFSYRFFLFTFLVVSTLLHQSVAVDDVYWDKAKLEHFAQQTCSSASLAFHRAFLEEVATYASQEDVAEFIQSFQHTSSQLRSGPDTEVRPVFVAAQGDFERTLAFYLSEGKITHLVGIIHTPTPVTPLCTRGEISTGLVAASMEEDSRRLYTVMKRPEIIREYMERGGLLIAAYPENGLMKRSEDQQAVFQETKVSYPENLMDLPLLCEEIQNDMIGATYLFRTENGDWMSFAIMASQANAPEDGKVWGMWFGLIGDPLIYARVHSLFNYLHSVQEKDLSSILFGFY